MMVVADYNNVDGDYNIEISKMCRLRYKEMRLFRIAL